MKYDLDEEQVRELRARQGMIEQEREVLHALKRMLLYEVDVARQLAELMTYLEATDMATTYPDDYAARRKLVKRQKVETRRLEWKIACTDDRVNALAEAMTFSLVSYFSIDPSLPWTLDIDNACLTSEAAPVQG